MPAAIEELPPPPFGLALAARADADAATIALADQQARHWHATTGFAIGSGAHRDASWAMFRDTFNPYKPSVIDWPALDAAARERLVNLPIWDIAVQTEGKARLRMRSYARAATDRVWGQAVELNGWEEWRHKVVLSHLVAAYGIALEPEPPYREPRDTEWAYLVTGFSECIDSFFAFGLFALARRSAFFPPELVETFEPVIQEEARHILLFANWLAWHRRSMAWWKRPWFELRVLGVWAFLAWERVGIARGMENAKPAASPQDNNFTLTGSKAVSDAEVSTAELMRICLAENDRRFAGYDPRLLRPTTTPTLARLALPVLRWLKR